MEKINLSGLSADALQALAKRASELAADLRAEQPSYELAIEAGGKDNGYDTVRCGWVNSYRGEAVIEMSNGKKWRCVGHGPRGDASWVSKDGYIEFIPMFD